MTNVARLPNTRTSQEFVGIILDKWQGTTKGIFETGLWLDTAREELGSAKFWQMVRDDLRWSKGMVSKLMVVFNDDKLAEVSHGKLPACWTTLYYLTRLTDEEFNAGIDTGVIHAGMERKDIKQLKPQKEKPPVEPKPKASAISLQDACVMEVRRRVFETIQEIPPEELPVFFADIEAELNDLKAKALGESGDGHNTAR